MPKLSSKLIVVAVLLTPLPAFAQGGGGSGGGGSAGGASAGGAASGSTAGSGSAVGSPNAGSAGAGTAGVSGVPSGPANAGGLNNSGNDRVALETPPRCFKPLAQTPQERPTPQAQQVAPAPAVQ
jgi:hypothetical protein